MVVKFPSYLPKYLYIYLNKDRTVSFKEHIICSHVERDMSDTKATKFPFLSSVMRMMMMKGRLKGL